MVAVLVLGGVGFIGRTLVDYLVRSDRASYIRVVDKGLPATAYLAPAIKASFEDPRVEFRQANIGSPAGLLRAFSNEGCAPLDGKEFDIVYNLAAETKYGQTDEVYDEKVYQISVNAGQAAAARKIPVFVEVSTAQVYDGDKKAATESSKTKPWTLIAKHKLRAEEALKAIPGLNLVIVRPSIVYGPGDVLGITPRLIVAAVYKQLQEDMKMLWTKDIRINTVHVTDVARALWWVAATKAQQGGRDALPVAGTPEIYNLSDHTDTDQGKLNACLEKIFGITSSFSGTIISQFAKLNLDSVTEDVNDKHLQPWSDLCKGAGIANTPLTPYLDKELLKDNALSVDGTKIEKTLGFVYEKPELTVDLLREVVTTYESIGIWPKGTTV